MFPRDNPGAYFTTQGMTGSPGDRGEHYYLLVNPNGHHIWTDWSWRKLPVDRDNGWDFVVGEDEHLIEGAALVAPLPILFWEKE